METPWNPIVLNETWERVGKDDINVMFGVSETISSTHEDILFSQEHNTLCIFGAIKTMFCTKQLIKFLNDEMCISLVLVIDFLGENMSEYCIV